MRLIAFSGGLDSTYLLWHLSQAEESFHAHSVTLLASRPYHRASEHARAQILDWFLRDGQLPFGWTESRLSLREKSSEKDIVWVSDHVARLVVSGKVPWPLAYCWGSRRDETSPHLEDRRRRATAAFVAHFAASGVEPPRVIVPSIDFSRAEMWGDMPAGLRMLTLTCRRPAPRAGYWEQCGSCRTCKDCLKGEIPLSRKIRVIGG